MEERIQTLHPQGKRGVHISRAKYETMKDAMIQVLSKGELTHDALTTAVVKALRGKFEGSIPWYAESLKLDLEARGIIERVRVRKVEVYRLKR